MGKIMPMKRALLLLCPALIFLSSCSWLGNEFSRQKYTGFKKGSGESVKKEVKPLMENSPVLVSHIPSENPNAVIEPIPSQDLVPEVERQTVPVIQEKPSSITLRAEDGGVIDNREKDTDVVSGAAGSSLPKIVMILLCIFIPWLAILLVENTTTRFWIALICWLIAFGAFGYGALGLFALIAIILAFMACF